jgi:hypothetical protein
MFCDINIVEITDFFSVITNFKLDKKSMITHK